MATPDLIKLLNRIDHRDFFQAVRLLELRKAWVSTTRRHPRVGGGLIDGEIADPVRFAAERSLRFPEAPISEVGPDDDHPDVAKMLVTFLGLYGPSGVLPIQYSRMVLSVPAAKPNPLRDFFDLFNHRSVSFFYRAWRKSRYDVERESEGWRSGRRGTEVQDPFSSRLLALTGWRSEAIREAEPERFSEPAPLLHFAGHHSRSVRSAATLRRMLAERADGSGPARGVTLKDRTDSGAKLPVGIDQCVGRWEWIDESARTRMSRSAPPQLGVSTTIGDRVWMASHRFRIRVGPVNWEAFQNYVPGGSESFALALLARRYVQEPIGFDLQVVLDRSALAAPMLKLGASASGENQSAASNAPCGSRLGVDCWLISQPLPNDAEDAVFDETECLKRAPVGAAG